MLGPDFPHLLVGGEFAASGGRLRGRDGGTFFGREQYGWRLFAAADEPKYEARDVVLGVRRKAAGRFKCAIEKLRHGSM
jgi:hypothetical protein